MKSIKFAQTPKARKRLVSSLLAVATLLTALVVLPITLPVIEAQAIAEGSPGSSIFWNDAGVANGGAKSHIYSFARLSTYYRSEGSNCTNTDARDDFFAARVNRNTNDPFIEFALWTPFDVSTKKSLYVVIIARLEYLYSIILCNDKAQTDALINQQMGNYQRYLYQLNFNENKPGNSVLAVQNMPDSMTFYSNLAQYPSIYNLSKVQKPTRQYYDFLGWAENSGASVPDYAVNTQSGPQLYANTPKTLYAVWRFQTCTWTIKIGSALQNTGQVFLFKITGASHDPGVVSVSEIYVMLGGETGKTQETVYLPLGQYTATPVNAWNWRYDNTTSVTKTFTTGGAGETLTFSANGNHPLGVANNRWLNGFSCVIK